MRPKWNSTNWLMKNLKIMCNRFHKDYQVKNFTVMRSSLIGSKEIFKISPYNRGKIFYKIIIRKVKMHFFCLGDSVFLPSLKKKRN